MLFKKEKTQMMEIMRDCMTSIQSNNISMIEKMQDCINSVQSNSLVLADTLSSVIKSDNSPEPEKAEEKYSPEQKWKAAYALNLCTVSVSQIIDYNDLRFMEEEYENILNNLNLQKMPDDDALLQVLTQILDVVNFFRIQKKERALLKKKYEKKMKDAIWSAAPNPSVILAGGSGGWIGMAVTAAISIGTGYMNYRKEKANINMEQEQSEWELDRALMEQLHGLRRQLFETAWRLSNKYDFDDNLRLTERQIHQYNEILTDSDPLRRYERLDYIKDKFKAFPPFTYNLGSSALQIANNHKNSDIDICRTYLDVALRHFNEFFSLTQNDGKILREDPVVAQCAFEYIAALDIQNSMGFISISRAELAAAKSEKIDCALKSSGNALDVMQLCAMNYLGIDHPKKAIPIMNMLINENYNVISNGQLLSMLYASQLIKGDSSSITRHSLLSEKLPYVTLFPLPQNNAYDSDSQETLAQLFTALQKISLTCKSADILKFYTRKKGQVFSEIWNRKYSISEDIIGYFESMSADIQILFPAEGVKFVSDGIRRCFGNLDENTRRDLFENSSARIGNTDIVFESIGREIISSVAQKLNRALFSASNMNDLSIIESTLMDFCNKCDIPFDQVDVANVPESNTETIETLLTGKNLATLKAERTQNDKFIKELQSVNKADLIGTAKDVSFFHFEDMSFSSYINTYKNLLSADEKPIAVITSKKLFSKQDLLFTTKGACIIASGCIRCRATYAELVASHDKNCIEFTHIEPGYYIYGTKNNTYKVNGLNYSALSDLIKKLRSISESIPDNSNTNDGCISITRNIEEIFNNTLRITESDKEMLLSPEVPSNRTPFDQLKYKY